MKWPDWVGLGAFFLALCLLAVTAQGWPDLGPDRVSLLSAVGTIAAALAAVWLGAREGLWRKQIESRERRIVTTIVRVELVSTLAALEAVLPGLRHVAEHPSGGQMTLSTATRLALSGEHISVANVEKLLDKLGYMGDDLGPRLAVTWAVVPSVRDEVVAIGKALQEAADLSHMITFGSRHSLHAQPAAQHVSECIERIRAVLQDL